MSTLTSIARRLDIATGNADGVKRILGFIAEAAFGSRANDDKFGAVTSVLAPLVADRVINAHKDGQRRDLWQSVVELPRRGHQLPLEDAARLNSMLHIEEPDPAALNPRHSGTLSTFPADLIKKDGFESQFGPLFDLQKLFKLPDGNQAGFEWYLLSYRAACDDAQGRPGPVPYVIAIEGPNDLWFKGARGQDPRSPFSDSIWRSPPYFRNDQTRRLLVSAYYSFSLSPEHAATLTAIFRIRDQLLSELINRLHAHGGRPGIVLF
jgi:hypothetical protein